MTDAAHPTIDPGARIGHTHLKVANIARAEAFYVGVLGFEVMQRFGDYAAFLGAGGYHHHIAINTMESRDGAPPPAGATGLFHHAILLPTRKALAETVARVVAAGITIDGSSDHGVSEAIYLRDPDENGVELYWDRPMDEWPRTAEGDLAMGNAPLDVEALLALAQ